ncbi:bacitracin resistance BacA family protein [Mycobacterium xenopi 4042]|uniref:Undecaprenyl-diphosphatase n=1 Tax=Mycobacterium xenopi 4042 TaxID=1299334 RepID=X8BG94_MYCXE|nr:bacitracin resistance BacA family protein [Mycobacterium xenopi 4042]
MRTRYGRRRDCGPAMSWWQVVVLSVIQGLTEFLPVSSSGHLAIVSRIMFGADAGASFTAVTQLGTEVAVLAYFAGISGASPWPGSTGWCARRRRRDPARRPGEPRPPH